jgi:hypothetical protein
MYPAHYRGSGRKMAAKALSALITLKNSLQHHRPGHIALLLPSFYMYSTVFQFYFLLLPFNRKFKEIPLFVKARFLVTWHPSPSSRACEVSMVQKLE